MIKGQEQRHLRYEVWANQEVQAVFCNADVAIFFVSLLAKGIAAWAEAYVIDRESGKVTARYKDGKPVSMIVDLTQEPKP